MDCGCTGASSPQEQHHGRPAAHVQHPSRPLVHRGDHVRGRGRQHDADGGQEEQGAAHGGRRARVCMCVCAHVCMRVRTCGWVCECLCMCPTPSPQREALVLCCNLGHRAFCKQPCVVVVVGHAPVGPTAGGVPVLCLVLEPPHNEAAACVSKGGCRAG